MTVRLCMPIAICMSRDFQLTCNEIAETFGCCSGTIAKYFKAAGYRPAVLLQTDNAKQRFLNAWVKYGYSDKFEIIGEYTRKVDPIEIRCKLCGGTFTRIPESIYKQHSNIRCSNCWIHRDDETIAPRDYQLTQHLADAYSNGDTVANIAKAYNLDERVVSRLIKETGINTNPNRDCYVKQRREENQWKNDAKVCKKRILFEFKAIEKEITKWRKALNLLERETQKVLRTLNKLDRWIGYEFNWYKDCLIKHEPQIAVCRHCGKQWLFWPVNESDDGSYRKWNIPIYCSEKCKRKEYRKYRSNHRSRAHHFGVEYESGITLDKVEKRFGSICYLCGGKTDRRDKITLYDGYQVTGNCYPTIDHMIPMVKGGGHVWPNTKLAHKYCNSIKSDKLLSELQLPFSIPKASEKVRVSKR